MSQEFKLDKETLSELMIKSNTDGWEVKEHAVIDEWRHGNIYRVVAHHPDHGYIAYEWQDQQNQKWSSFEDEPDPVAVDRVQPQEVIVTKYVRA